MPRDLQQLLEDTATGPTQPLDARRIVCRARRQRLATRVGLSAASALAVVVVAVAAASVIDTRPDNSLLLEPGGQPSPPSGDASGWWSDSAAFSDSTDTVMLFDSGADRVLAVDLDAGMTARRPLEGHRAGDQPHRLWRTADALVVGWEDIYTVSISTGQSQLLGEATVFVPAAESGHVWLIDFASGRAQRGTPVTYRLVTTDGEVQVEASGIEDSFPAHGIIGGLAVETDAGVAIWGVEARDVVRRLSEGPGFVADAQDRTIVWCEDPCSPLYMTDLDGEDRMFRLLPETGEVFDARSARLSPDGRYVAAIAGEAGPFGEDSAGTVVLLDLGTGQVTPITPPLVPRPAYLGWTQDGSQLFFSSYGYGAPQTNVGRYLVAAETDDDQRGQLELITLPVGGTLSFVTLHHDEAEAFLEGAERLPASDDGEAGDVPVPDVQGLSLTEAQQRLAAVGLVGTPAGGPGWSDPDEPEAVVVSQKPDAGTLVARGEVVGFRTALVTPELCAIFRQVPPRHGDAHALARAESYWNMLREALPLADPRLSAYIDELLAHQEQGGTVAEAPRRALDSITIHHDACARSGPG